MNLLREKLASISQAHNLIWLVIVVFGSLFTYYFNQNAKLITANEHRLAFEAQVLPRYALLSTSIDAVNLRLNAIASYLGVTDQASEETFSQYALRLGVEQTEVEYCWVSLQPFVVHSLLDRSDSRCAEFSPLQTSNVFFDEKPRALLSLPVHSENTVKGFAVAVVPLQALITDKSGSDKLHEFLVLMDTSRNLFQSYSISDNGIASTEAIGQYVSKPGLTFPLKRIGAFDFVYVAKPVESDVAWFGYGSLSLNALIWSLFFAMALYVRAIIYQRSEVQRQVDIRTEELSQFSYRASHDLKSPLSNIGGLVRFAQQDARDGNAAELDKNLAKIAEHVTRLQNLVGDILDLAMSDVKAGANEWVDLNRLLEVTIDNNAAQASAHGVTVKKNFASLPDIQSSNIRLLQIMDNLVSNAIKYADQSKPRPTVTIETKMTDDEAVVLVTDNGIGIPDQHMEDLFTVFTRFHPEHGQGSGLGLSIVKRHVDKLGGKIRVESTEQIGTAISVSLPLARVGK